MPNVYDIGDTIRCSAVFKDANDTAFDPAIVVFKTKKPDGAILSYGYGLTLQGNWNAAANTPILANGAGAAGHRYTVSVAGTIDLGAGSITFAANDWIFYDGAKWRKLETGAGAITKDSTGNYHVDVDIDTNGEGEWHYAYRGLHSTGANRGGEISRFKIDTSEDILDLFI